VSQVHHVPIVYIPGCGRRPSSGSGVDEALGAVIVRPHARRLRWSPRRSAAYGWRRIHSATPQRNAL